MADVLGGARETAKPLVVDLDGTLVLTDLLAESYFSLAKSNPLRAALVLPALIKGKGALKDQIAKRVTLNVKTLPYNASVIDLLNEERARGRRIFLASAADSRHAESIAAHLGLFDGVFSSTPQCNLAGAEKAALLCREFGHGGFDYIGNARVDLPVWSTCRRALVASNSSGLLKKARGVEPNARKLSHASGKLGDYVRALRPHQWLKNLLIFGPAIAAHAADERLFASTVAFVSFSLCASSVYIVNDLLDLEVDREHARKRLRPFASGSVPVAHGAGMAAALLFASMLVGGALGVAFAATLLGYFALTLCYSLTLKRQPVIDVVTLACLYGIRLVAGSAATAILLSPWMAAMAVFLFLCLAIVKRCAELVDLARAGGGDPVGRGYRLTDLPTLQSMAAASGYVSVLVFALYLNSSAVSELYKRPYWMWSICIVMLFWISRVLLKTSRGEMHDDPVVFAVKDRVSQLCAITAAAAAAIALI